MPLVMIVHIVNEKLTKNILVKATENGVSFVGDANVDTVADAVDLDFDDRCVAGEFDRIVQNHFKSVEEQFVVAHNIGGVHIALNVNLELFGFGICLEGLPAFLNQQTQLHLVFVEFNTI